MSTLDPHTLALAKSAAANLKAELEPLILGKRQPAWSCCCGAIFFKESEAVEVVPAGQEERYQDQVGLWYLWTVRMKESGSGEGYSYSCGLDQFIEVGQVRELFQRFFAGVPVRVVAL